MTKNRLSPSLARAPEGMPTGRCFWSGQLRLGSFSVPIKAYPATVTTASSPLRQVHAGCGGRIEYRRWCPQHGAVAADAIVKAYPYNADEHVELDDSDLTQLQPRDDKTIHLKRFFDPDQFDLELLAGRSLHVAPAHPAAQRHYAIVLKAFTNKKLWGLGHVVFSGRRQLVVVRPGRRALMLHVLHWPAQRRALPLDGVDSPNAPAKEVKPLERVIAAANGPITWNEYRDETETKLADLVEAKRAARTNGRILSMDDKPSRNGSRAKPTRRKAAGKPVKRRKAKAA